MALHHLCPPALIYLVFSIIQIVIDIGQGMYNTALAKVLVATVFAILLNYLCNLGLGIISWIFVFLPFIFMSVIISVLLYVLGLSPRSGKLKVYKGDSEEDTPMKDPIGVDISNVDVSGVGLSTEKNIFNKSNEVIQQQQEKIKQYEEELERMKDIAPANSNVVPEHYHHSHSHSHAMDPHKILNNENMIEEEYNIKNKINKDAEIKKLKNKLKNARQKNKKLARKSLGVNYDEYTDSLSFSEMNNKELNQSIDIMLKDLKNRYR